MARCLRLAVASLCCTAGWCVQSGQLTAADSDDNLNFDFYLTFKSKAVAKSKEQLPDPDLSDRVVVNVTDAHGKPFAGAVVEVGNAQLELPTGTNGLLSVFPKLDQLPTGLLELRAKIPGGTCPRDCSAFVAVDKSSTVSLQVPSISSLPSQLDVAFVVDTTGSMCDELKYLQVELADIIQDVKTRQQRVLDAKVGLVLYKDQQDEYVVQTTAFGSPETSGTVMRALTGASCGGGGDYPEAMDQAMYAAAQMQWRTSNTARVLFLVADAPPHDPKLQHTLNAALALRKKGVKVYGLAASGVADTAEYLMRLMAVITGARHLWLTDDSGIGNSHQEPKVLCYQVTHLDQLLTRILDAELKGSRVEALPSQIVREVGHQEKGICIIDFQPTMSTTTTSSALLREVSSVGAPEMASASPGTSDSASVAPGRVLLGAVFLSIVSCFFSAS